MQSLRYRNRCVESYELSDLGWMTGYLACFESRSLRLRTVLIDRSNERLNLDCLLFHINSLLIKGFTHTERDDRMQDSMANVRNLMYKDKGLD